MNKRSHFRGSIQALVCTVLMISFLVLLGCPTDGGDDGPGNNNNNNNNGGNNFTGGGSNNGGSNNGSDDFPIASGSVSGGDLASAFSLRDSVTLGIGVTDISGVVPKDKTLVVKGNTEVTAGQSLDIQGALQIDEGALLDASYTDGDAGYLKKSPPPATASYGYRAAAEAEIKNKITVTITGKGAVKLPYLENDETLLPLGMIAYNNIASSVPVKRLIGSYRKEADADAGPGASLNLDDINELIDLGSDIIGTEFTLDSVSALTPADIPAGVTFTLTGVRNTITRDFALADETKKLIIEDGAVVTVSSGITITGTTTGTAANIIVEGALKLGGGLTIGNNVNLTKATIDATALGADATLALPTGTTSATFKEIAIGSNDLSLAATGGGLTELRVTSITSTDDTKGVKGVTKYSTSTADYVTLPATAVVNSLVSNVFSIATDTTPVPIGSPLTIEGSATLKTVGDGGITGTSTNIPVSILGKFESDSKIAYTGALEFDSDELTIPADVTVSSAGALTISAATTVDGTLIAKAVVSLSGTLAIGTDGSFALDTGVAVTFADTGEITAPTYGITAESGDSTGTITAGVAGTAVVFTSDAIIGADATYESLAAKATDPTSAATLTFGDADSELTISGATTVTGVILDVSAKGKITVEASQTLTLGLGDGTNGVASGGIFTKTDALISITAVKANGVEATVALATDTAAGLASATIAATGTNTAVEAATPAAGVITGAITIDIEDEFTVASNAITVAHS
jgi:hypothetical protein